MADKANNDKYMKLEYNPLTGDRDRQWIHYADDTFEPVRKDGDLKQKGHSGANMFDWWVVNKPQDWNPLEQGFNVSLNHDYGKGKPAGSSTRKARDLSRWEKSQGIDPDQGSGHGTCQKAGFDEGVWLLAKYDEKRSALEGQGKESC